MDRKPTWLYKTLVVGVIVLFVGVGVFQNISGYDKKSNDQLIKKTANNLPFDYDFINAYWKADECNETTLWDCSSHNYNGTIYGATWDPGCCLDFDGLDDYVDLTDHVKEIAINKTDDCNITFYFKSTSNSDGIILSYTGNYYDIEFRIELKNNGSIYFLTGKEYCSIELYSNEGYNDDLWHFVRILLNGDITSSTVELYVDGNLDASVTKYVCEFENTDFHKATIGKKASDDSCFFEGQIDELKFIKYEGGNQPPTLEINGSAYGQPYHEYELSLIINDSEGDEGWIKIDWGDGNITDWLGPYKSGETVNVSHIYIAEGIYYLNAKTKDFWDESHWSESFVVLIGGYPLFPPIINGPRYGEIDVLYDYTFVADNIEGHDLFYFIDWGDGNYTEWVGPYPPGEEITISHSWSENGTYAIIAKVRDLYRESGWSEPYFVRIGDYEDLKINIEGPTRGIPDFTYYYNFTIDEYDGGELILEIDWGDGNIETVLYDPYPAQNVTVGHYWEKQGTYIIKARAKDEFGYWPVWEGELKVVIPRSKVLSYQWFLNWFPILERLLSMLL
jgi:hypothetical protein